MFIDLSADGQTGALGYSYRGKFVMQRIEVQKVYYLCKSVVNTTKPFDSALGDIVLLTIISL